MKFPGFIGGTYTGQSPTPAGDRCINLYPESMQGAGAPENNLVLLGTPGLLSFATIAGATAISAVWTEPTSKRLFAVAGGSLYEVLSAGTSSVIGSIGAGPYSFASNALQMMIVAAGGGYIYDLTTDTLTAIPIGSFLGASKVVASDQYFITLVPSSSTFQISALNDGTTWSGIDTGAADGGADYLVDFAVDHRELWLAGSRRIEVFTDTGNASFPFERLEGVYIETGVVAGTFAKLDNSLFWLGQDERGAAIVWRARGYTPQRVSNHSVEYFLSQYQKFDGLVNVSAYSWEFEGHSFYRLDFPNATSDTDATGGTTQGIVNGATWVFDVATSMWHELTYWKNGIANAHLARTHAFAFGKHLVGDYQSGNIYEISSDAYDDNGAVIRRVRRGPHLNEELAEVFYHELALAVQVGAGNTNDPNPSCALRTSNDGGLTWGSERARPLGKQGNYKTRVRWLNLGMARRRAYEWSTTARVPVCLIDAYLRLTQGTS